MTRAYAMLYQTLSATRQLWHSAPWQAGFYAEARGHSLRDRIGRLLEPETRKDHVMRKFALISAVLVVAIAGWVRVQLVAVAQTDPANEAAPPDRVVGSNAQDLPKAASAAPRETPIDPVTEALFEQYILSRGKIQTSTVEAAIELVSDRGRGHAPFVRRVLAEFKTSCDTANASQVWRNTLSVLTKLFEADGNGRWQFEQFQLTGDVPQTAFPPVAPGDELTAPEPPLVLKEALDNVIEQAYRATACREVDAYVVAVRQAHDPSREEFLRDVLNSQQGAAEKWMRVDSGTWTDAHFHAAVGLAELGDYEGVKWLIAHTDAEGGESYIDRVPHYDAFRQHEACRLALTELTGYQPPATPNGRQQAAWEQWGAAHQQDFTPRGRVNLRVP